MDFKKYSDHYQSREEQNIDYLDTKFGTFNKDESVITIYMANLSYDLNELEIKAILEQYGYVNYVKLIKDSQTYKSKGIAFAQMPHANHARAAIKGLNGADVEGRKLKVRVAVESNQDRVNSKKKPKKIRRKPYKPYISKAKRAELGIEI